MKNTVCADGLYLIWNKWYHGYQFKEEYLAQESEVYVKDDKSIRQEFSWKNTKGRGQMEYLDVSGSY